MRIDDSMQIVNDSYDIMSLSTSAALACHDIVSREKYCTRARWAPAAGRLVGRLLACNEIRGFNKS